MHYWSNWRLYEAVYEEAKYEDPINWLSLYWTKCAELHLARSIKARHRGSRG